MRLTISYTSGAVMTATRNATAPAASKVRRERK